MLHKTKIVCTLGPSTLNKEILTQLIDNGMTVARVNGAFADVDEMRKVSELIRSISSDVALLIDVKGHELRLNKFDNDLEVKPGDIVVIGSDERDPIYVQTYSDLYRNLTVGTILLIDDGNVKLTVDKIENKKIYAKVLSGNIIKKAKGINVPGVYLDNPPLTDKDREQIKFAVEDKWDFVALSFVRSKADVDVLKELLIGTHTKIISKIEDTFGVQNIDEIIEASEGIMVARGDMGVELPYYKVPQVQKEIIKKCNLVVKPVIVATQMLESMIKNVTPTRAEVSDIANAVEDGADAIMLSGETTTGLYPVECVKVMKETAIETEKNMQKYNYKFKAELLCEIQDDGTEIAIAISKSVADLAYKMPKAKIVVDTKTGFFSRLIAYYNPSAPVIAATHYDFYARRLALSKGIKAIQINRSDKIYSNTSEVQDELIYQLKTKGIIFPGDEVILVISASYNLLSDATSNEKAAIKILTV